VVFGSKRLLDTNASPIHLAIAEVSKAGELLSYQAISLHRKDHLEVDISPSGGSRGLSHLHISHRHAKVCTVDKDIASTYVIGRRAPGFKEDMPENYEKLLKDKAYLEFALKVLGVG
jgi:hypothetical protein